MTRGLPLAATAPTSCCPTQIRQGILRPRRLQAVTARRHHDLVSSPGSHPQSHDDAFHQGAHGPQDDLDDSLRIEGRGHCLAHAEKGLQPCRLQSCLGVESGVFHGDGGLARHALKGIDVLLSERLGGAVAYPEEADDISLEGDRDTEQGDESLVLDHLIVDGVMDNPRFLEIVGGDKRLAGR